jgi:hypothetical protein
MVSKIGSWHPAFPAIKLHVQEKYIKCIAVEFIELKKKSTPPEKLARNVYLEAHHQIKVYHVHIYFIFGS